MKTVIEMAREAGAIHIHKSPKEFAVVGNEAIERFAALVRADERDVLRSLKTDAHYIFNNPPGEASQEVRDVIEWYDASIRVRGETK